MGRLSPFWGAAFFLGFCVLMSDGHTGVVASGCPDPECLVTDMAVSYQCRLRELTATFTWRRSEADTPERHWLQVTLFKDLWDPAAESVLQVSLGPGISAMSLPLEPDSVYYWRLRSESDGRIRESDSKQIQTPSCIADFVEDP
jgi:hypothetical protein